MALIAQHSLAVVREIADVDIQDAATTPGADYNTKRGEKKISCGEFVTSTLPSDCLT